MKNKLTKIKPDPCFHRSSTKLHSRTIEYSFAIEVYSNEKNILDLGSAKANKEWLRWLSTIPAKVVYADFDYPESKKIIKSFVRLDSMSLPFKSESFDLVYAISFIEHVGLEFSQVLGDKKPKKDDKGDLKTLKELKRVVKKGGKIVLTFPFGKRSKLFGKDARIYSLKDIENFNKIIGDSEVYYYEYLPENLKLKGQKKIIKRLKTIIDFIGADLKIPLYIDYGGEVNWLNLDINNVSSMNNGFIDGVLCGIWRKR